jgi:polysaccharide export outer membrane protein
MAPGWTQGVEYTIGIGDELEVTVWQRAELGGNFVVDTEGNVTLPLVGAIRASGQTPARLGEELTRRFSFVDREVSQVTVAVREYNSRRVYVMGEVIQPGSFAFARIPSVWEVIREAGGPTPEAALSRVRIIPPEGGGPPQVVDLELVISTGDFGLLPDLRAGSTILIPRAEVVGPEGDVIHVYGNVGAPGTYSIDAGRTLLQAILTAGGPAGNPDMSQVRVVRPGPVRARVFTVDLEDYTHDGILFANIPLLPGDTVTIPANQRTIIWGAVRAVANISTNLLATIFFFRNFNDENTTTVVRVRE